MVTTAASVETRVLVERFENIKATVFPVMVPWRPAGMLPSLIACFARAASRTSVVSSLVVRSAMDKK